MMILSLEREQEVDMITRRINVGACPHLILALEHYREDGSCKCDDPNDKVMEEWGYEWDGKQWQSPEDDNEN
jgi:hypothetical protein